MTADKWLVVSERAWRNGTSAASEGQLEEARFWLGRARLAAQYARRPPR
jgi:hypothetical protein